MAGIGSAISAANALVAGPTTALAADRRRRGVDGYRGAVRRECAGIPTDQRAGGRVSRAVCRGPNLGWRVVRGRRDRQNATLAHEVLNAVNAPTQALLAGR
ncbi:Pe-pgrs family protein [Mycobacterium tuberculosis variant bovis BCG str. ATCC 35743]|nr:Pe-pgrs family protein [Mycobacterium tuberculosis variant bovis BCG str. ATCC 35743]